MSRDVDNRDQSEIISMQEDRIRALTEAVKFWKNAVKNTTEFEEGECQFCRTVEAAPVLEMVPGKDYGYYRQVKTVHKPDCPWLLAQKE